MQYAGGNTRVIESSHDLITACRALKAWGNERAIPPLKDGCRIDGSYGMPNEAIVALASYPQARGFLRELAKTNSSLSDLIDQALQDSAKSDAEES
jgi:hypothetical protein